MLNGCDLDISVITMPNYAIVGFK